MYNKQLLSKQEAQKSLEMMAKSESAIQVAGFRYAGNFLLLWGLVYVLVPMTILHFGEQAVWLANGLIGMGVIVTMVLEFRDPMRSELGFRIGVFWWFVFGFAVVWMIILGGENFPSLQVHVEGRQTWAFGVTISMLLFVLMGLLYSSKVLIGIGIGVTFLTLMGFFVAWELPQFYYWMAGCSGVPVLAGGLWFKLQKISASPMSS